MLYLCTEDMHCHRIQGSADMDPFREFIPLKSILHSNLKPPIRVQCRLSYHKCDCHWIYLIWCGCNLSTLCLHRNLLISQGSVSWAHSTLVCSSIWAGIRLTINGLCKFPEKSCQLWYFLTIPCLDTILILWTPAYRTFHSHYYLL